VVEEGSIDALADLNRRKPNLNNRVSGASITILSYQLF
jgi:hypothetical protein